MPLNPSQILQERYRIDELIGQGGFGAVYKAWDLVQNRVCACKENLDTGEAAIDQFGQEAVVLASLSHPNLPRVTDHFVLPGMGQYLVMDFVEGRSLAALMAERGALPEGELLPWIDQVCAALAYLHSQLRPVIHRDVKPQNIIITPASQALLVDFGISKVAGATALTRPGGRAVTTGFSPPEQYGLGHTDARSDIYALGATLYAALTGCIPPDSLDCLQGNAALTPPGRLRTDISAAVETAILKAMALPAAQRFQTVDELLAALGGRAASLPATRASAGTLPVTRRAGEEAAVRRTPRLGLVIGGLALVAMVALGLYLGDVLPPLRSGGGGGTRAAGATGSGGTPPVELAARISVISPSHTRAPPTPVPATSDAPELAASSTAASATARSTPVPTGMAAPAPAAPTATRSATATPIPTATARLTLVPTGTAAPTTAAATAAPGRTAPKNSIARPAFARLPKLDTLGPALLHESFNSETTGWAGDSGEGQYSNWDVSLAGGRYRMAVTAKDDDTTVYTAAPEIVLTDFLLEVDATIRESSGPFKQRFYFRCGDTTASNCYVADFTSDGEFALGFVEGRNYTALRKPAPNDAIRTEPGDTNTFAIVATGATYVLYANGESLVGLSDNTYRGAGYFMLGVGVGHAGDWATIDFDNLFVVQPSNQAPPAGLPDVVTPAQVELFERFDDNAAGWDVGADTGEYANSNYQVTGGVLRASVAAKEGVVTHRVIPDIKLADFGLWVDTTFTSYTDDGQANIIFRCQDDTVDNCTRVRFRTDGAYSIGRWQDGVDKTLVPWTESDQIRTGEGAMNSFGVIARGALIQVIANDKVLRSYAIANPGGTGDMRLGVGAFVAGAEVTAQFDNLLVVQFAEDRVNGPPGRRACRG